MKKVPAYEYLANIFSSSTKEQRRKVLHPEFVVNLSSIRRQILHHLQMGPKHKFVQPIETSPQCLNHTKFAASGVSQAFYSIELVWLGRERLIQKMDSFGASKRAKNERVLRRSLPFGVHLKFGDFFPSSFLLYFFVVYASFFVFQSGPQFLSKVWGTLFLWGENSQTRIFRLSQIRPVSEGLRIHSSPETRFSGKQTTASSYMCIFS